MSIKHGDYESKRQGKFCRRSVDKRELHIQFFSHCKEGIKWLISVGILFGLLCCVRGTQCRQTQDSTTTIR